MTYLPQKQAISIIFILLILILTSWHYRANERVPAGNMNDPTSGMEENVTIQRFGMVIKIKPDKIENYKKLHKDPWPEVLTMIETCQIQNYSIYLKDDLLFSYFEYTGTNFEEDMKKMAADSITMEWWKLTNPCQVPLDTRKEGEWWAVMEEVFHMN